MDVAFAEIVDLKEADAHTFLALPADRSSGPRIFGGQLLAQALAAAGRTVPDDRPAHSLHGHFLHAGSPDEPIEYRVTPLRDGRAQSVRQVVGTQGPHALFALTASFATRTTGPVLDHQVPDAPPIDPADIPTVDAMLAGTEPEFREWFLTRILAKPVDIRFVGRPARDSVLRGETPPRTQEILVRIREAGEAHAAALAYLSDLFLLSSALAPHQALIDTHGLRVASLDHSLWFHDTIRADEWLRYRMTSNWAGQGRGLCQGEVFDGDGRLVATVVQEGLIKP